MADAAGARLTATPVYPRAQAELLVGSQLLRGQRARETGCVRLQPAARVTSDFRATECADMRGIQCAPRSHTAWTVGGIRSATCGL
jgi:hypothetical protein